METQTGPNRPSWRRKTVEERRRDERLPEHHRIRLRQAPMLALSLVAFIGAFAVLVIAHTLAGGGRTLWGFAVGTIAAALLAIAGYVLSVQFDSRAPRVGICDRCFMLTLIGTIDHCDCGGTFEDINGWTLNRCPQCDYDLRASEARCPECGHDLNNCYVIPPAPTSTGTKES